MVFPFFRKSGPKPPAAVDFAGGRAAPAVFVPPTSVSPAAIEVEEIAAEAFSDGSSAEEEAAVLYANDRVEQALATLIQCTREAPCRNDPRPWLMLFELYQLGGERQSFEELALEFVVQFERSAPAWPETAGGGAEANGPAAVRGAAEFAPRGVLSADDAPTFQRLRQAAGEGGGLRLDLSKITGMEASGSELLLDLLQGLKKSGVKVQLGGTGNPVGLLKEAIRGAQAPSHWLLLLELYQILGMRTEFEELAIDYAVTLEISPPSWERSPHSAQAQHGPLQAQNGEASPDAEAYRVTGVISGNSEQILRGLAQYAAAHGEVRLDLSQVPRVDFGCVGNFLNALMQLNAGGKRVRIQGANEMVAALFSVMGIEQFATLERKKWR